MRKFQKLIVEEAAPDHVRAPRRERVLRCNHRRSHMKEKVWTGCCSVVAV